ncbi:MAG: hypothetical protein ABSG81_07785, partial [Acidimicrobiales bacterium]
RSARTPPPPGGGQSSRPGAPKRRARGQRPGRPGGTRRRGSAARDSEALAALRPTGVVVFTELDGVVMTEGTAAVPARDPERGPEGHASASTGWKRRLLAGATWLLGR